MRKERGIIERISSVLYVCAQGGCVGAGGGAQGGGIPRPAFWDGAVPNEA